MRGQSLEMKGKMIKIVLDDWATLLRSFVMVAMCRLCCAVWALVLVMSASVWAEDPAHYTQLSFQDLPDWEALEPQRFSLDNGAQLLVLENHELPLVQIRILLRTGEVMVPKGKEGLGEVFAQAMRSGGCASYPGNALNTLLEQRAARLSVSVNFASTEIRLNFLRQDLQELLAMLGDFLANPLFPEDKIFLAKKHALTRIARRNDDQQAVTFREFKRMVYGPESVYGRLPQVETVQGITREDLVIFHERSFGSANMLLGVVGDVQAKKVKDLVRGILAPLPTAERMELTFPPVKGASSAHTLFLDMPDVNQVSILMGHLGGRRQSPDYPALQVMNAILSQGFSSRLFENLRTRKGLAYSVYGQFGSKALYPGVFLAGLKTKSSNLARATKALRAELVRLQEEGVTEEEVQRAKQEFLNSLVFRYDTPREILSRHMYYAYRDMPADSFDRLIRKVKNVQTTEISRAAREHIQPDNMQVLMVGNQDQVREDLEAFEGIQVRQVKDLSSSGD